MMHLHSPSLSTRVGAFDTFKETTHGERTTTQRPDGRHALASEIEMVPLRTAAMHDRPVVTPVAGRAPTSEPMSRDAMIQVLKARKLSVHGAYVYHLGIPPILLLAAAYATDRITRKVFFDTLDLFVQHTGTSSEDPKGIKAHHLTRLGIPAQDAKKLPLDEADDDLYTVAGLFNGLIEMEDLDLLYSPEKKGQFLLRHFPGMASAPAPTPLSPQILWYEHDLLVRRWTFRSRKFENQIAAACAELESGPNHYSGINHYLLRLTAATRSGKAISELGPMETEEEMEKLFHDIFQVVEPNYQPSTTWRQDLEHFHFVEPSRTDNNQHPDSRNAVPFHANHQKGGSRLPCNLV